MYDENDMPVTLCPEEIRRALELWHEAVKKMGDGGEGVADG